MVSAIMFGEDGLGEFGLDSLNSNHFAILPGDRADDSDHFMICAEVVIQPEINKN
jgi:hypothetical protein